MGPGGEAFIQGTNSFEMIVGEPRTSSRRTKPDRKGKKTKTVALVNRTGAGYFDDDDDLGGPIEQYAHITQDEDPVVAVDNFSETTTSKLATTRGGKHKAAGKEVIRLHDEDRIDTTHKAGADCYSRLQSLRSRVSQSALPYLDY